MMRDLRSLALQTSAALVVLGVSIGSAGCGNSADPAVPSGASVPSSPSGAASSAASTGSAPASTDTDAGAEPVRRRKPFEVYNACTEVVTVVFGDDPKAANANKRTMAASSSAEGPRNADGNQTVWLLDTSGEGLVKVNVTRGMKRVEVGRSCRTLDAR